jgi:hypothetical protein
MDIFIVAAGPRYVRRRPGTTAGHGLSPRVAVGREPRELHHVGFDELDVLAY